MKFVSKVSFSSYEYHTRLVCVMIFTLSHNTYWTRLLHGTILYSLILGAVQIYNRNVTSKDVELVMGQWLAKASERLKKTSLEETNR